MPRKHKKIKRKAKKENNLKATDYIQKLGLTPHPEGGHYGEIYRSDLRIQADGFPGKRSCSTAIYFLLQPGEFSALHRILSDEMWHFYAGDPLEIIEIQPDGILKTTLLGNDLVAGQNLTHVVPAGHWFGSRVASKSNFSLVGCTVSPGFDFADFEMPDPSFFLSQFPQHKEIIQQMTRRP